MPTLNERAAIEQALASLQSQDTSDIDLEILVVDGNSTDGTPEIVRTIAAQDSRVRLIPNPERKTPVAFNRGLDAARGEYVCILGAHSVYPRDYIVVCLREMLQHGAIGCSGTLVTVPANDTVGARLAAWTLSSGFASSPRSVRTRSGGFVDTIPFPLFRKQALIDIGGYDETLDRNQDNDLNQRLRAQGHRLFLTAKTTASYKARGSVLELWKYAFRSGWWNGISLWRKPASMSLRHLVPAAFVAALILSCLLAVGLMWFNAPPWVASVAVALIAIPYLLLSLMAVVKTSRAARSPWTFLLPPVFFGFHSAYGAGTLASLLNQIVYQPSSASGPVKSDHTVAPLPDSNAASQR